MRRSPSVARAGTAICSASICRTWSCIDSVTHLRARRRASWGRRGRPRGPFSSRSRTLHGDVSVTKSLAERVPFRVAAAPVKPTAATRKPAAIAVEASMPPRASRRPHPRRDTDAPRAAGEIAHQLPGPRRRAGRDRPRPGRRPVSRTITHRPPAPRSDLAAQPLVGPEHVLRCVRGRRARGPRGWRRGLCSRNSHPWRGWPGGWRKHRARGARGHPGLAHQLVLGGVEVPQRRLQEGARCGAPSPEGVRVPHDHRAIERRAPGARANRATEHVADARQ